MTLSNEEISEIKTVFAIKLKKETGFKKAIKTVDGVEQFGGTTKASASGTTHSATEDEKVAFVDWINYSLGEDEDLKKSGVVPVSQDGDSLYTACHDGVLMSKLINTAVPNTIDERALNMGTNISIYKIHENQTLSINSSKAIGCNVVNVGAQDLIDGVPHLCLGIIWQIIRIGLLTKVNLNMCPGLVRLVEGDETLQDLMALPAEQILLRWFNFQLKEAGSDKQVKNFSADIKDSEGYTVLLKQIAPKEFGVDLTPLQESNLEKRAESMLVNATKIDCRRFVKPKDVTNGNAKLNLAFVANLFNLYPHLEIEEEEIVEIEEINETREEKTFRNWMNSLGVQYVGSIYQDLRDGQVLLELFDKVYPGLVDWKIVNKAPFTKMGGIMKKIENDNYAVKLGQEKKFSLIGIDGKDIYDGHQMFTLAIVWQLMRAYTLEMLKNIAKTDQPMVDKDIIAWTNSKLAEYEKSSSIKNFKNSSISDSMAVIDLIDSIKPGSINYDHVIKNASSEKDELTNAKYAISMARKVGAGVYALPEDIVEVNQKMVMTVFACIMYASYADDRAKSAQDLRGD
ncbi:hypothetical protein SARC_06396 [Sphaeroforma arctica JP610]|uniref:Fimbrin n=1 Tax=Sphaeroforma arctica JP610 TaxID=667725 RepID=A0A0L0FWP8_9EUKA|nr:hypothetical protein SARC_06396 [Sphaeroforma arctica JP610]KNC81265.1 hypothetical protein SARC_06396 [Sphaeroforma arctica JP610]|eukprot:XP_014155167.1 hypothetical protein SARC_06396 [Sphaeroforma arctica JP610]